MSMPQVTDHDSTPSYALPRISQWTPIVLYVHGMPQHIPMHQLAPEQLEQLVHAGEVLLREYTEAAS